MPAGRSVFVSDPELRLPFLAFLDAVEASEQHGTRCPFYLGKARANTPTPPSCAVEVGVLGVEAVEDGSTCVQVPLRSELPELMEDIEAAACDFPIEHLKVWVLFPPFGFCVLCGVSGMCAACCVLCGPHRTPQGMVPLAS